MIRVLHLSRPSLTCARRSALGSALATCVCLMVATGNASAQLAPNQTHGFGHDRLVTFTYHLGSPQSRKCRPRVSSRQQTRS